MRNVNDVGLLVVTDQDKAKAIERANSYRQMMEMWAWKDFQRLIREKEFDNEVAFHNAPQEHLTPMNIGEYRGWKKAFLWMEQEIGFILEAQ